MHWLPRRQHGSRETSPATRQQRGGVSSPHARMSGELPVVTRAARRTTKRLPQSCAAATAAVARLESESSGTRLATQLSIAETREADVAKRLKTEPDTSSRRRRN